MSRRSWTTEKERNDVNDILKVAKIFLFLAPFVDRSRGPRIFDATARDHDMAVLVLLHALQMHERLYAPLEDESIPWEDPPMMIDDVSDSDAQLYFRFRKEHLYLIADKLWPRLSTFFSDDSTRQKVKCNNKNVSPYETGFLMMLFRFSRPVRIRPEMERYFHTRKTKLSNILKTFVKAYYLLALPYLSRVEIWVPRMDLYASLIKEKSQGLVNDVWAFIDVTLWKTCRPFRY